MSPDLLLLIFNSMKFLRRLLHQQMKHEAFMAAVVDLGDDREEDDWRDLENLYEHARKTLKIRLNR